MTKLPLTPDHVTSHRAASQDMAFTHPVFAQCFLPLRKLKGDEKSYQVKHGRASLAIDAGRLLNPITGDLEIQDVPYGSASRLVLAHIHNHIVRAGSLDAAMYIPMGDSLRRFFETYRLKVCGSNGKQIVQQVHNIAAAHITIGTWTEDKARQINFPTLAEEIDFWLEKDERQRSLWQPGMILNRRYAETIRERAVPLDMRALVGLYEKPRAMDVFTWLSYRLPLEKSPKGTFIPYFGNNGIQGVFGRGIQQKNKFRTEFVKTLKEVARWYPNARIQIEAEGIRLYPSPSPVNAEYATVSERSLFFVDKPR